MKLPCPVDKDNYIQKIINMTMKCPECIADCWTTHKCRMGTPQDKTPDKKEGLGGRELDSNPYAYRWWGKAMLFVMCRGIVYELWY